LRYREGSLIVLGRAMRFPSKILVLLGIVAGLLWSSPASARTPFDGAWTVTMNTVRGDCAASFYFGVQVYNGRLSASGGGFNLTGRVSPKGMVSATVGSGNQYSRAYGRLGRRSGAGTWVSPSRGCAGRWAATRR
jgi:hypothetical protein